MAARPELLIKPTVTELSPQAQGWVLAARLMIYQEQYFDFYVRRNGGFDPSIHPTFRGWYIDQEGQRAIPVYATDNELTLVDFDPMQSSVTSWPVEENLVYLPRPIDGLPLAPAVLPTPVAR
jgi:hypothetical protein